MRYDIPFYDTCKLMNERLSNYLSMHFEVMEIRDLIGKNRIIGKRYTVIYNEDYEKYKNLAIDNLPHNFLFWELEVREIRENEVLKQAKAILQYA
jgi:hypothetical protein